MRHLVVYQNGGIPASAIIAEKGEVYKDLSGTINKISNKAPSHDSKTLIIDDKSRKTSKGRGGIVLQDVSMILSASQNQVNSGSRGDSAKEDVVAVTRDEAKEFAAQFGLSLNNIQAQISPAALYSKLKLSKDKLATKIGKKADNTVIHSQIGQTSFEANMARANALPTDDELFDNIFALQESKKAESGIDFSDGTQQFGGPVDFAKNWFQQRAGFNLDNVVRTVSEGVPATDINLRSKNPNGKIEGYYDDKTKKIVINKGATDKDSTKLHEETHAAQYQGLPNYDYQKIIPRAALKQQIGNSDYLTDPKEVHSRLMQYRRDAGLSPTDVIDNSTYVEGGSLEGSPLLQDLNIAKRQYFQKENSFIDYGIEPVAGKPLKDIYRDQKLIGAFKAKGIRGDMTYDKLTPQQKKAVDNALFEYDDNAAFDLYQQNPEFERQFYKQKGVKVLPDPRSYNLPTDRKTLNSFLNDLTANSNADDMDMAQHGGIHIKPENRGKFTSFANSRGMGVQEAAAHVLANKDDFSPERVKQANFARNAAGWNKGQFGGMIDSILNYPQKKLMELSGYPNMTPSQALDHRANINEHGWEQGFRRDYPRLFKGLQVAEDVLVDPLSVIPFSKVGALAKTPKYLRWLQQAGNVVAGVDAAGDALTISQAADELLHKPKLPVTASKKFGGSVDDDNDVDYQSIMGYRDDSPYRFADSNQINSNLIDMSATGQPLVGVSNTGDTKIMQPYSGNYEFEGDTVTEYPLREYGGGEGGGGYTAAQKKGLQQRNAYNAAQIEKGLAWIRNNPNASKEDIARIQAGIADLKSQLVPIEEGPGPKGTGVRVRKPIPAKDFAKGVAAQNDPSNIGVIETDDVIKPYGQTHGLPIASIPMQSKTDYKLSQISKPFPEKIEFTAQKNPVAQPTEQSSSFSDENDTPKLPQGETVDHANDYGLKWYDVAGDVMSLIDAQNRTSPVLQQVDLPRIRLARPSADGQVNAIRQNFLTALSSLKASDDTTGAANVNQLMTNANQQMMQAVAQGQQLSIDTQNKEEVANQQIIADETLRNLQLRDKFTMEVLKTDEAQRQQTLSSFQNIFDKIAKADRFKTTEETFRSVFAKNFKRDAKTGRLYYESNPDNDPFFLNPVGGVPLSQPVVTTTKKK